MITKTLEILGRRFLVTGDSEYLGPMGDRFEPQTVSLLLGLCDADSQVLDVGANIGMTALTLSQVCVSGRVVALEPVPHSYELLTQNLCSARLGNVVALNFGAGSSSGTFTMEGAESNAAGAFVADRYTIPDQGHFSSKVEIKRLDDVFHELGLERLDFVKFDVEGFELEALAGAQAILQRFKPRVLLEMNHWCLNALHNVTLPEFRARLLETFPFVYAVQFPTFLDFAEKSNVHSIYYHHLVSMQYMNIVAGFDREDLLRRLQLSTLSAEREEATRRLIEAQTRASELDSRLAAAENNRDHLADRLAAAENDRDHLADRLAEMEQRLVAQEAERLEANRTLDSVIRSKSWRITEPLRRLAGSFKEGSK